MATEKEIEELAVAEAIWMSNGGLACVFQNIKVHGVHEGNLQKQRCVANAIAAIAALDAHRAEKGSTLSLDEQNKHKYPAIEAFLEQGKKGQLDDTEFAEGYFITELYADIAALLNLSVDSHEMVQSGAVSDTMWRSMDSAPRDGSWIFAYWPTMNIINFPTVVFWDGDINRDSWVMPNNFDYGEVYPTHWMPIPAVPTPPKETQPTEK